MSGAFPEIRELLPHGPQALVLDRILDNGPESVRCELMVRARSGADEERGVVDTAIGIEYLAQAAGVRFGLDQRATGKTRRGSAGFLLAIRKLECAVPAFAIGRVLIAEAMVNASAPGDPICLCFGVLRDAETGAVLMSAALTLHAGDDVSGGSGGE